VYALVCFGQGCVLGCYPRREGAHRAEAAPGAWGIDEGKGYADDGGEEYDVPEYPAHCSPVAPCEVHLDTEHGEDEEHHEQTETEGAHEAGNGTVGGVFGEQTVVHVASRTDVAAPVAAFPDGGEYWPNHADEGKPAEYGEKPCKDEVGEDYPIELWTLGRVVSVKSFLCHECKVIGFL